LRVAGPGVENALNVHLIDGRLNLKELLHELWMRGHTGLLVEGGARTIAGFFEAGLVDRVELFVAPRLLGSGPAWVEGLHVDSVGSSLLLGSMKVTRTGNDLRISCEIPRPEQDAVEAGGPSWADLG